MQDLENNMDELFRKAAENYPLKAGESSWGEISGGILTDNAASNAGDKKRSRRIYAGLFLFLLMLVIGSGILIKYTLDKREISGLQKTMTKNIIQTTSSEKVNSDEVSGSAEKFQKNPKRYLFHSRQQNKVRHIAAFKDSKPILKTDRNNYVLAAIPAKIERADKNPEIRWVDSDRNIRSRIDIDRGPEISMMIKQKVSEDSVKMTMGKKSNEGKKQRRIYVGGVIGPAFNEVKSQELRKPGFDLGLIAGLQFSRKASIETGLIFSRKYYFSKGKYFNMSSMPTGMELMSLDGSSTIFEIPINFRYGFFQMKNSQVFSSAGISSYIMTSEKNIYLAKINGTLQNMKMSYENTSGYFAAALNLSLGYEKNIGELTRIRIEPYIQLPLKGIGIGKMPVKSAGLRIGITGLTD